VTIARRMPLMTRSAVLQILGDWRGVEALDEDARRQGQELVGIGISPVPWWFVRLATAAKDLALTGNIAGYLDCCERELAPMAALDGIAANALAPAAIARLYLGDSGRAFTIMQQALDLHRPTVGWRDHGSMLALCAWSGRDVDAHALWARIGNDVTSARAGADDAWAGWPALIQCAIGLSLLGEREACGALYPGLESTIAQGHRCSVSQLGPTSPQLSAAIAAECGGLIDRARAHFEEALRLADTLPDRLVQPAARMWYGRFLARQGGDDRSRGLAMLRKAADDFAALKMPIHHERAVRWINEVQGA
jgi:hypothetical protein